MPRYGLRNTKENKSKKYRNILKDRGVKILKHYTAPKFFILSDEQIQNIRVEPVIWKIGTRFYKLADEEYGDPNLWWVIGFFNQKPTDAHYKIGDKIAIPHPIEDLVSLYYRSRE